MGLYLYQIGGDADYTNGMGWVLRFLRERNALSPAMPVDALYDSILSDMDRKCPRPMRKHFTRTLRRAKTPEAVRFREDLYARLDVFHAMKHADDDRPPEHKFMCSSGWIITPDECRSLLSALSEPAQNDDDFPYGFRDFVRACLSTGFSVD
jgi:hypothetical protein